MTTKSLTIGSLSAIALAGLVGAGVIAPPARAGGADESREATALEVARVSLSQAIAIAERQTGGHAFDAGVDGKGKQTRIVVETNGPAGVQTVAVDAQSGQVVGGHAGGEQD